MHGKGGGGTLAIGAGDTDRRGSSQQEENFNLRCYEFAGVESDIAKLIGRWPVLGAPCKATSAP